MESARLLMLASNRISGTVRCSNARQIRKPYNDNRRIKHNKRHESHDAMLTTETCLDQQHPFANSISLLAFNARRGNGKQVDASFAQAANQHAREAEQLLRQISVKAPQLTSVLEQLNEGSASQRVEFDEQALRAEPQGRFDGGAMLDAAAGFLSHAFPANAPLFHGCRAFLQLKIIKNKKQA